MWSLNKYSTFPNHIFDKLHKYSTAWLLQYFVSFSRFQRYLREVISSIRDSQSFSVWIEQHFETLFCSKKFIKPPSFSNFKSVYFSELLYNFFLARIVQVTFAAKQQMKINHEPYSRSTFEFPSRVNLSVPSLYCIARTLGK